MTTKHMPTITEFYGFTGLKSDGSKFSQKRALSADGISWILPLNHDLKVGDSVPVGCQWIGRGF